MTSRLKMTSFRMRPMRLTMPERLTRPSGRKTNRRIGVLQVTMRSTRHSQLWIPTDDPIRRVVKSSSRSNATGASSRAMSQARSRERSLMKSGRRLSRKRRVELDAQLVIDLGIGLEMQHVPNQVDKGPNVLEKEDQVRRKARERAVQRAELTWLERLPSTSPFRRQLMVMMGTATWWDRSQMMMRSTRWSSKRLHRDRWTPQGSSASSTR